MLGRDLSHFVVDETEVQRGDQLVWLWIVFYLTAKAKAKAKVITAGKEWEAFYVNDVVSVQVARVHHTA